MQHRYTLVPPVDSSFDSISVVIDDEDNSADLLPNYGAELLDRHL